MRIQRLGFGGLALSLGLGLWACSSDDSAGTTGTAGNSTSSGGSSGSDGSGGNLGVSGANGTGGQGTSGSSNGGSGGSSAAGSSGAGGSGITDAGGGGGPGLDAAGAVDAGPFTLTSTAYTEGMTIPAVHTCAGANTSPPLAWTPGPAGTKSYTLIFTDKSNMLVHWALWDIAPTNMSLPAALPAGSPLASLGGAQQVSISGKVYAGPCPGANIHTYQFDLYAVDVDKLPGLTANSKQPDVVTAVKMHSLKIASLAGMAKTQ